MIRFGFNIGIDHSILPRWMSPKDECWADKHWYGQFKNSHKGWEVQTARWEPSTLVSFDLDLRWRGRDHAGPQFALNVLGFWIEANITDERHWDYEKNTWKAVGEM